MARKCRKCGVPLEGFGYTWIASKLFGVRPSEKDGGFCNKCDREKPQERSRCCRGK